MGSAKLNDFDTSSDEEIFDEDPEDELLPPLTRYRVSSFGADFDVEGLMNRLDRGDIFVPDFQRAYVWSPKQASQFIESILLGLPVPGIMLAIDDDDSEDGKARRYVVDGLQRLTSLQSFITGMFPNEKVFRLESVQTEFNGKTFQQLSAGDQRIIRDYVIHATIIKQEEPDQDKSGIYSVFRRLNTNGTPLTPQEIRAAIYYGSFSKLLGELAELEVWKSIFPANRRLSIRKEDEELILRFLALFQEYTRYQKPLELFLNKFMSVHQNASSKFLDEQRRVFVDTITLIHDAIGVQAFKVMVSVRRQFNRAAYDSIMIGIATRLKKGAIHDYNSLKAAYDRLIGNEDFLKLVSGSTSDERNMHERITAAIGAFDNVD